MVPEVSTMRDEPNVVVKGDSSGPVAWLIGVAIIVAAVLFVLFYWHPWNTTSTTTNTTTVTQPGAGGGQNSNSSSSSTQTKSSP
jgi:hypothetical protein